ncbi:MAG: AbrB/MazE/SpoVT family DNA-binding domain-containing protein [Candidatus Kariarchaeaceae archaeon]|jgi:bifunctional DNA-binding transcriptional regulator/antitoxin component of YhaV-PrlF toxin-antitoxin module
MVKAGEVKVGKRGEILPKQPLREIANINPGDRVLIEATPGEFKIRKIYTMDEAFDLPIIATGTIEEIEREIDQEARDQEHQVD